MEVELEDRVDRLEALFGQFMAQTNRALIRMERGMERLHEEMSEFKNRMELETKQFNKKWGELANKMGTIAEDIVAPAIQRVAKEYFGCEDIDEFVVRCWKTKPTDRSCRREFDVIAVCRDSVILNETKSTPRSGYIEDFIEFLKKEEFYEYFPHYKGKKLIPVFSSLYLPPDVVTRLSRNGIYAMAMSDSAVDILNYKECTLSKVTV